MWDCFQLSTFSPGQVTSICLYMCIYIDIYIYAYVYSRESLQCHPYWSALIPTHKLLTHSQARAPHTPDTASHEGQLLLPIFLACILKSLGASITTLQSSKLSHHVCAANVKTLQLHTDLQFLMFIAHAVCISIRDFRGPSPLCILFPLPQHWADLHLGSHPLCISPRALWSAVIFSRLLLAASLMPTWKKNKGAGAFVSVPEDTCFQHQLPSYPRQTLLLSSVVLSSLLLAMSWTPVCIHAHFLPPSWSLSSKGCRTTRARPASLGREEEGGTVVLCGSHHTLI